MSRPEKPDAGEPDGESSSDADMAHDPTRCIRSGTASAADVPWYEGSLRMMSSAGGSTPPPVPLEGDRDFLAQRERRPWLTDYGGLGEGGMGTVRAVRDAKLRRLVAMKVLEAARSPSVEDRLRFLEEAQITGQLDHPNIPPVHDLWIDENDDLRFTMKRVNGRTLSQVIREAGALADRSDRALEEIVRILLKVCDAVSFAHSRGVVHRDLKPENVMVGSHGQVYVMDWGCALVLAGSAPPDDTPVTVGRDPATQPLDAPGIVIGTAAYMAPEQARALASLIDERTDVYLLGGILYEILTLGPPHRARGFVESVSMAQQNTVKDPLEAAAPAPVPPELRRIVLRALATQPGDRYQTVVAFKEDLEESLRRGVWFHSATFPAGSLLVREGDPADCAYILTRGTCEAFRVEDGQRVVLRRMSAGETFGETAIFTDRPRTASVEAIEPVTVTVVTRDALERAVGGDSWAGAFVRALAERFHELDEKLRFLRQRG